MAHTLHVSDISVDVVLLESAVDFDVVGVIFRYQHHGTVRETYLYHHFIIGFGCLAHYIGYGHTQSFMSSRSSFSRSIV
jgi:hypothetical protein